MTGKGGAGAEILAGQFHHADERGIRRRRSIWGSAGIRKRGGAVGRACPVRAGRIRCPGILDSRFGSRVAPGIAPIRCLVSVRPEVALISPLSRTIAIQQPIGRTCVLGSGPIEVGSIDGRLALVRIDLGGWLFRASIEILNGRHGIDGGVRPTSVTIFPRVRKVHAGRISAARPWQGQRRECVRHSQRGPAGSLGRLRDLRAQADGAFFCCCGPGVGAVGGSRGNAVGGHELLDEGQ
jgi:hypothetical protein